MNIQHAHYNDLEQIVAIYNESIPLKNATADLQEILTFERLDWFNKHSLSGYPLFVAKEAHEIIGWCSLSPFYGRPAYSKTAEISIYVRQDFQDKGIASQLFETLLIQAKHNGFKQVLAFIFAHNTKSISFFTKREFEQNGILPKVADMDGFMADLCILQRGI